MESGLAMRKSSLTFDHCPHSVPGVCTLVTAQLITCDWGSQLEVVLMITSLIP